jgi:hypothetical protein
MSRYAQSLGIMEIEVDGVKSDFKPTMLDFRDFRNLCLDTSYKNDFKKQTLDFEDWLYGFIIRHYPTEDDTEKDDLRIHISKNTMEYFEKLQIGMGLIKEEDLIAAKQQLKQGRIKNLIESD